MVDFQLFAQLILDPFGSSRIGPKPFEIAKISIQLNPQLSVVHYRPLIFEEWSLAS